MTALRAGILAALATAALAGACASGGTPGSEEGAGPASGDPVLFVGLESEDAVAVVDPAAGTVLRKIPVGVSAEDLEGVHALLVAPGGGSYYISIAHGFPFGAVWKFATGRDSLIARTDVGLFPATLAVTPDGTWLFVANYNLHGDPRTDTVSIIHAPTMTQVKQLDVCTKPHGLTASHDGTAVYVSCTRDNVVKKISVATLSVVDSTTALVEEDRTENRVCYPAGLALSRDDRKLYIACHRHAEVRVMSTVGFGEILNRIPVGDGPYLLQVDPEGERVWVPNRNDQTYSVISTTTERVVATNPASASHPHTFAFAPDGSAVYLSMESHGVVPGAIDVIDRRTLATIRSIPVGLQATGVGVAPPPREGGARR
jgi:DNA-binding beta-propeller fold protein YncE